MEHSWRNIFNNDILDASIWKLIYKRKIIDIPDKKIAEFNYKLLMNLVTCNKTLHKWKKFMSVKRQNMYGLL